MVDWDEYGMRERPSACKRTIPATRIRQIMPMVPGESDHKYAIQKAHQHSMFQMDNHSWVLQQDQRIAPASLTRRKPLAMEAPARLGGTSPRYDLKKRPDWGSRAS